MLTPDLPPLDLPADASKDSIMAGPHESQQVLDWADSVFLGSGRSRGGILLSGDVPPFSFVYGGFHSSVLLRSWRHTADKKDLPDRVQYVVHWTDPETGLDVNAEVRVFKQYPAADCVLYFENTSREDTPIIENIQALDVVLRTEDVNASAVLHQITGDYCFERSYVPLETPLGPGNNIRMAPIGGRSSNGTFPFFNLQYRDEGVITAIGWTGQWAASLDRSKDGPTRLAAGLELTHLRLHPGERIRSPRILLFLWKGDRLAAHNRFRRLLLFKYLPRHNGELIRPPISAQGFCRYFRTRPEWSTEAGQIAAAKFVSDIGGDTHWLDAAWFEGAFPHGVGNWYPKPKDFPNGLKPVGDYCHRNGLRFLLWYEPERVYNGTQIDREHPEFVLRISDLEQGLFKLNDPVARKWLTDLLSQQIEEFGIDIYRNDFNFNPLPYWRHHDTPDRQGMTEIRYVEGLYAMWDELVARHPGLILDNCASGGRRIDLEMSMRAVTFTRSDTPCTPGREDWNQSQTYGLSQYIPLHAALDGAWEPDVYGTRSSTTAGFLGEWPLLDDNLPKELARSVVSEIKQNQKYWYGDFYPLTTCTTTPDQWIAYQLHRPDLDEGLVLVFRRRESDYPGLNIRMNALNPEQKYSVEFIDNDLKKTTAKINGRTLISEREIRIPRRSSLVIRYKPAGR